jgi:hypothetical protein
VVSKHVAGAGTATTPSDELTQANTRVTELEAELAHAVARVVELVAKEEEAAKAKAAAEQKVAVAASEAKKLDEAKKAEAAAVASKQVADKKEAAAAAAAAAASAAAAAATADGRQRRTCRHKLPRSLYWWKLTPLKEKRPSCNT